MKLKSYRIVTKLFTQEDSVNATFHFEFQVDIPMLATVGVEFAKLLYSEK